MIYPKLHSIYLRGTTDVTHLQSGKVLYLECFVSKL